jgi:outer membrane lipoprotein-sorting protein
MIFTETKEKQSSQGYMAFMKPKSIFIERKTPQEQKIYISGKNMTIWTIKTGQAIVSDVPESINGDFSPVSFLNFGGNWKNLQKTNTINYVSEDNNEYVLSVYPKQNKTWEMTIHILKDGMNPNKIIVKSKNFSIDIDLSNYKINQTLNKKVFKIPQGVEVIKLN